MIVLIDMSNFRSLWPTYWMRNRRTPRPPFLKCSNRSRKIATWSKILTITAYISSNNNFWPLRTSKLSLTLMMSFRSNRSQLPTCTMPSKLSALTKLKKSLSRDTLTCSKMRLLTRSPSSSSWSRSTAVMVSLTMVFDWIRIEHYLHGDRGRSFKSFE